MAQADETPQTDEEGHHVVWAVHKDNDALNPSATPDDKRSVHLTVDCKKGVVVRELYGQ